MKTQICDNSNHILQKSLGKKKSTRQYGNSLFIKVFEEGATIRIKGQSELTLDKSDAGDVALTLREFSYPKMFTEPQLNAIKKKFSNNPDVCAFVNRVIDDDLKYEEY